MNVKQLFADEDAVSPVIGVILMVAITVILAAVIGTFVLGLGENVQDSAPQANFQFEYSGDFTATTDTGSVNITHTGGEDVDVSTLSVSPGDASTVESFSGGWSGTVSTGSTNVFAEGNWSGGATPDLIGTAAEPGQTVRVIWTSPSGSTSQTIGQSTIPN